MAAKRRLHDDDDGRVIASMNVDGMPWYQRGQRFDKFRREKASDFSDLTKEEEHELVEYYSDYFKIQFDKKKILGRSLPWNFSRNTSF